MRKGRQMRWRVAVMVFSAGLIVTPFGWADDIELANGTRFSGTVSGSRTPEFAVVDLDGTTRTVAAGRGRVTLLAFWATWCPHCRVDVSLMKSLAARYQQQPLQVITVSVDRDRDAVKRFIREHEVTYPVISTADPQQPAAGQLPALYGVQGIPAYYLVDADGVIVSRRSGSYVESRAEEELEEMIRELLADVSPVSH